jgi:spermidine/putrescine transport system permease protein
MRERSYFPQLIIGFTLFFLYLPIIILVISSFNTSRFSAVWGGFSFKWYLKLFSEPQVLSAFGQSLIVATSATIASTVLGTFAAFALHRFKGTLQKVHYALIFSPLLLPDLLMGVSLLIFFVFLNMKLGLFTIFLAHTTFCVSYVTFVVMSRLQNFDFSLIEAAWDLGATPFQVVKKVIFPIMGPGILAAALLAFTLSIDDFVVTFFVAGPGSQTLPLYIYGMIKYGTTPIINALSTILLAVTFIIVGLTEYLKGSEE